MRWSAMRGALGARGPYERGLGEDGSLLRLSRSHAVEQRGQADLVYSVSFTIGLVIGVVVALLVIAQANVVVGFVVIVVASLLIVGARLRPATIILGRGAVATGGTIHVASTAVTVALVR